MATKRKTGEQTQGIRSAVLCSAEGLDTLSRRLHPLSYGKACA